MVPRRLRCTLLDANLDASRRAIGGDEIDEAAGPMEDVVATLALREADAMRVVQPAQNLVLGLLTLEHLGHTTGALRLGVMAAAVAVAAVSPDPGGGVFLPPAAFDEPLRVNADTAPSEPFVTMADDDNARKGAGCSVDSGNTSFATEPSEVDSV